jgi:hypothetical protein
MRDMQSRSELRGIGCEKTKPVNMWSTREPIVVDSMDMFLMKPAAAVSTNPPVT